MTRKCAKCGKVYELTNIFFHKDRTRKSGFSYICKECSLKKRRNQTLSQTEEDIEKRRIKDRKKREDVSFKLLQNFSRRMRYTIKKGKSRCFDLVNYSRDDLLKKLEETLPDGFSINDYGTRLHLDHIIPISVYKITSYNDEDFHKCWNIRNLRLLEASKNISKNNSLDMDLIKQYGILDLLPSHLKES